jgi:hypothetical protein
VSRDHDAPARAGGGTRIQRGDAGSGEVQPNEPVLAPVERRRGLAVLPTARVVEGEGAPANEQPALEAPVVVELELRRRCSQENRAVSAYGDLDQRGRALRRTAQSGNREGA